jgi:hypothetical protein
MTKDRLHKAGSIKIALVHWGLAPAVLDSGPSWNPALVRRPGSGSCSGLLTLGSGQSGSCRN